MGLLDWFRRKPPIRDTAELADFIDENAAFLVQKGIYEYSRARAGHYAKVLFAEEDFKNAIEESRWKAYPLGLAMVAELTEGALRPHAGDAWQAALAAQAALVLAVFDRYPPPPSLGAAGWSEARAELARRLALIGMHPPKFAKDIPEPFAESYFSLMPIHKSLRDRDFPAIRNYLKVTMCNIHDELTGRVDAAAVTDALRAPAP